MAQDNALENEHGLCHPSHQKGEALAEVSIESTSPATVQLALGNRPTGCCLVALTPLGRKLLLVPTLQLRRIARGHEKGA